MSVKPVIEEIENDVIDVAQTNFVHIPTNSVPSRNDSGLTYKYGVEKKGKVIKTCVLFVDIRNSVALTEKHHNHTMGKIYTAFTKAVLKAARHHNGHTRNIIGDRVMVVFPSDGCFTNAVLCAISINHIAHNIISRQFPNVDFKCGIGIDYGELRVIKVGIQRNGTENAENKGLVWVGYPANIASRLTDMANKTVEDVHYEVKLKPYRSPRRLLSLLGKQDPALPMFDFRIPITKNLSAAEFADLISNPREGELSMTGGEFVSFQKKVNKFSFPPILMTEQVFSGYKGANPDRNDILANWWKEQDHPIPNIKSKILGGYVIWVL